MPAEDRLPTAAQPLAPDTSAIDPAGLRQYHFALGRAASRFRVYPPQAREAGWQGRVTLRLAMVAGGIPRDLILRVSSGHPALDQAAQEMLRQAIDHTPVPETLRGQPFIIDLAIDFDLTDPAPTPPR